MNGPRFTFLGQSLSLRNSVNDLGHIHITFPTVKIFLLLLRICVVKLIVCYIFLPALTPLLKLASFLAFVSHSTGTNVSGSTVCRVLQKNGLA